MIAALAARRLLLLLQVVQREEEEPMRAGILWYVALLASLIDSGFPEMQNPVNIYLLFSDARKFVFFQFQFIF